MTSTMLPASSSQLIQKIQNGRNSGLDDTHVSKSGDLRRHYLTLLPLAQIIDICLHFEPYVPPQAKHTVWPTDIDAAIASLKKARSQAPSSSTNHPPEDTNVPTPVGDTPSQQVHPPGTTEEPSLSLKDVLDSVEASRVSSAAPSVPITTSSTDQHTDPPEPVHSSPQLSAVTSNAVVAPVIASVPSSRQTKSAQPQNPETSPQPSVQASPPPASSQAFASRSPDPARPPYSQTPYHFPTYGYPGQASYAQAPYYAPSPGYLAPYPGYQPYAAQTGYPPTAPHHAPLYPPRPVHPAHAPHTAHQHSHTQSVQPPSGEDLPSYEDMIVEALVDMGDPEGTAPKDIFLWMESRYPLQTNFRPSASQALQKAFKRRRFEKRPNGKYRLNPSWEGGATSRRTTRRPQTLAQTAYAQSHPPQSSSPFTHTPLTRQAPAASTTSQSASSAAAPSISQPIPYPGYYNAHGYGGYPAPAYGAPPSQLPPNAPAASTNASVVPADSGSVAKEVNQHDASDGTGEGSDAWEAAQHILQAINFGSLQASSSNAENSSNAPAPVSAEAALNLPAASNTSAEPSRGVLTSEERASLQAQLALLAAQLSEIAELDEEDEPAQPFPSAPNQSYKPTILVIPPPQSARHPPPVIASSSAHVGMFVDVNHFTDRSAAARLEPGPEAEASAPNRTDGVTAPEQEGSDDDDMEMVEVPTVSMMDALRA